MADEEHCPSLAGDTIHFSYAFILKRCVSYGQYLVDEQNFWLQVSSDGKGEPYKHSAAVAFYWGVEKLFDLGKIDNFIELSFDFSTAHSEDCAIQKNILSAGQFRVKACPNLKQAGYSATDADTAFSGFHDSA